MIRLVAMVTTGVFLLLTLTSQAATAPGKYRITWEPPQGDVDWPTSMAISPDGKTLAVGSRFDFIRLFNVKTWAQHALLTAQGSTDALAFSPDGRLIAGGGEDWVVRIWDTHTGKIVESINGHTGPVTGLAFTPDGATLISASHDGTIRFSKFGIAEPIRRLANSDSTDEHVAIDGIALSRDGKTLAAWGLGGTRVWNIVDGKELFHQPGRHTATLSPDGKKLFRHHLRDLEMWSLPDGKRVWNFARPYTTRKTIGVSPDSETVVVGDSDGVELLNVNDGTRLRSLTPATTDRPGLHGLPPVYSPDGRSLFTADVGIESETTLGSTIRTWSVSTGKEVFPPQIPDPVATAPYRKRFTPQSGALSPDGKTMYVAGTFWDTKTIEPVSSIVTRWPGRSLLSADGSHLVTTWENIGPHSSLFGFKVWDVASRKVLWGIEGDTVLGDYIERVCEGKESLSGRDTNQLHPFALSRDGKKLLVGRRDGRLILFDATSGRRLWEISDFSTRARSTTAAQFSADGRTFLFEAVDLCDGQRFFGERRTENGELSASFIGLTPPGGQQSQTTVLDGSWQIQMAFPAGQPLTIVVRKSPSRPNELMEIGVVDLRSHFLSSVVSLKYDAVEKYGVVSIGRIVHGVGMSADGKWLAVGDSHGIVHIWNLQNKTLIHVLKHRFPTEDHHVRELLFSPDGRRLYTLAKRWRIWDVATGDEVVVR